METGAQLVSLSPESAVTMSSSSESDDNAGWSENFRLKSLLMLSGSSIFCK